ncbi:MAG: oligosaccharide flippase family protein [Evtepia gabavorous]
MRGVAVLTITGVLSQLVGFVYRIGLTRLAGAEILGLYQLILPVYSVLLSLTSVGLTTAVSNLSAWYQALGNQRAIYQVRGQAVKLFFLLALMPCSLLLLFSDGASVYLLGDARTQMGLILLVPCLLLTGTENLQKHYFYGTGRVYPAAITELAEQVLRSLLVLALLWRLAPDTAEKAVGTIVLGMALCEVVSALTQTVLFRVYLGPPAGLSGEKLTPKALRGKIGRIALPLGFAALLGTLISSANAVLIPRLLVQGGMDQGRRCRLRRDLWHDAAHALAAHGLSQRFGAGTHPQALPVFRPGTEGGHPPAGEAVGGGGQSDPHSRPGPAGGAGSAIGQSLYRDDRVGIISRCWPWGCSSLAGRPSRPAF